MKTPPRQQRPVRKDDKFLINARITAPEVRLIGDNVERPGEVVALAHAKRQAEHQKLDLVLVSPNAQPPVCRIADYKKLLFTEQKREKEMQKKQKENNKELKEIRFSSTIAENDVVTKKKKIVEFVTEGHKVKLSIRFKGRGITYSEQGQVILLKIAQEMQALAKPEALPSLVGRSMSMTLTPLK